MTAHEADAIDATFLRSLVDRYALAVDDRDARALEALFVPGATITIRDGEAGEEQSYSPRQVLAEWFAPYLASFHIMANHVANITGDSANGQSYIALHRLRRRSDGSLADDLVHVRATDFFVRDNDQWRFSGRQFSLQWHSELAAAQQPFGG